MQAWKASGPLVIPIIISSGTIDNQDREMSLEPRKNRKLKRTISLIFLLLLFLIGFVSLFPYIVRRTLNVSTDSMAVTAFCILFLCVAFFRYKPQLKFGKISRLLCIVPFAGFLLSLIAEYLFPHGAPSAADFISLAFGFLNLVFIPAILTTLSISWLKVESKIYVIAGFIYVLVSSLYSFSIFA